MYKPTRITLTNWSQLRTSSQCFPPPSHVVKALETALTALERHTLFADFRTVHVFNSAVTLYHTALPRPLPISELTLTLSRTADSVNSKLRFTTSLSDTDVKFTFNTTYERSAHQLSLKSDFANLRPAALATLTPTLATLSGATIPLAGSLDFKLTPQDTWPTIHFNIRGAAGQVTLPSFYRAPLQIKSCSAIGHLNSGDDILQIEAATFDLDANKHDTLRLNLQGTLTGLNRPTRVESDATLTAFNMADLKRYWPSGLAQAPRRWITQNMPKGLIQKTKVHLVLDSPKAPRHPLAVRELTGSFHYEKLDVHYLRPLPAIQHLAGKGQFNRSGFRFHVADGKLAHMDLKGGEVEIRGLDQSEQTITIRADVTGSLRKTLALLNHSRLNLTAGLGIPLYTATGRFHVEPRIAFSLSNPTPIEDIEVNIQGMLQDVSLHNAILSQDLSNGQLYINLDRHRMTLEGQAEWATIPLSFTWQTMLTQQPTDVWRDQIHVIIPHVGHAGRARLGYDLPGIIEGPMVAVIDTQTGWDEQQIVNLQLDLRDTTLHLPWLNWHKPAGEPAKAIGRLNSLPIARQP